MSVDQQNNYLAPPMLPTFSRYRHFASQTRRISLTWALQYECLARQTLTGKVLDVGGGENAGYREWLKCESYDSVNIDPAARPTWVVEVGQVMPCADAHYDVVLSMDTFEHIFDVQFVLREIFRVLKPGGGLAAAVPFLFPVHASPEDFFRPTPTWFFHALTHVGFKNVVVTPLVWGAFSTGLTCSGVPGPGKSFRKQMALFLDLLSINLWVRYRSPEVVNKGMTRYATSFFVQAVKST